MTGEAGAEPGRETLGQPGPSWRGDGALGGRPRASAVALGPPSALVELGLAPAPYRLRVIGFLVDQLLFAMLYSIVLLPLLLATGLVVLPVGIDALDGVAEIEALLSAPPLVFSQVALTTVYRWIWNALGWSPGKRLLGLRTIDARGEAPGLRKGLLRAGVAVVSDLPLWLGYAAAGWDRERRTWHDRIAGTWVVRAVALDEVRERSEIRR
jgi:uncharacterized RDD family membrane protein YckC